MNFMRISIKRLNIVKSYCDIKILFYKKANRWYVDIPNISKGDCEMVLCADSLIDRL